MGERGSDGVGPVSRRPAEERTGDAEQQAAGSEPNGRLHSNARERGKNGPASALLPWGAGGKEPVREHVSIPAEETEPDARVERLYRAQAQHKSDGQRPRNRAGETSQPSHEPRERRGREKPVRGKHGVCGHEGMHWELWLFAIHVRDRHGLGDARVPAQRRGSTTTTDWS